MLRCCGGLNTQCSQRGAASQRKPAFTLTLPHVAYKLQIAVSRITRLEHGNPGDVKPIGGGVSEMRIDYGPGYRVYYAAQGSTVVILLCGGDKRTQDVDIKRARALAKEL
jgi:putative addiction module killer protein